MKASRCVLAVVVVLVYLFVYGSAGAQTGDTFHVGTIDFFGGEGLNTAGVLAKLPLRVGQIIKVEQADQVKASVSAAVLAATGNAATDVSILCCDRPGELGIYIGLQGKSYRAPAYAATPAGDAKLPDDGVELYEKESDAIESAGEHGDSAEDDSQGYALTKDPKVRAIQLEVRAYALKHATEIERVLHGSKDANQRQAAAMLLGYGERSAEQVKDLAMAANDADSEVRNNAVRALGVLALAQPLAGLDVTPFVTMLYSGQWTDRNKASALFAHITQARDPLLLKRLRDEAMGPLLDGARWQSAGHAYFFLVLLGRVGGIDEARLQKLIDSGAKAEIIATASKQ